MVLMDSRCPNRRINIVVSFLLCLGIASGALDDFDDDNPKLPHVQARQTLLRHCRAILNNPHSTPCDYMSTNAFRFFLDAIESQQPRRAKPIAVWQSECSRSHASGAATEPPVCLAFVYMTLPFDLTRPEPPRAKCDREKQSTLSRTPRVSEQRRIDTTKFRVSTFESDPDSMQHCGTVRTACAAKTHLEITGTEQQGPMRVGQRIQALRSYLSGIPMTELASTVVVHVDSRDVLFQRGKSEILRSFWSTGTRLLVSSQRGCGRLGRFPGNFLLGANTSETAETAETPSSASYFDVRGLLGVVKRAPGYLCSGQGGGVHLNGGAIVGYGDAMMQFVQTASRIPLDILKAFSSPIHVLMTHVYLSRQIDIGIDACEDVFQTFSGVEEFVESPRHSYEQIYARGPWRSMWGQVYLRSLADMDRKRGRKNTKRVASGLHNYWARVDNDYIPPILHFERGVYAATTEFDLKEEDTAQHRRVASDTLKKHGVCSNLVVRFEALMWGPKSTLPACRNVRIRMRSQFPRCVRSFETVRDCVFPGNLSRFLHDKRRARLALWTELSGVRRWTELTLDEHRSKAQDVFNTVLIKYNGNATLYLEANGFAEAPGSAAHLIKRELRMARYRLVSRVGVAGFWAVAGVGIVLTLWIAICRVPMLCCACLCCCRSTRVKKE